MNTRKVIAGALSASLLVGALPGLALAQKNTSDSTFDVHMGQRTALMGISLAHWGQFLVVGSAGGASSLRLAAFMLLTSMKMAKATMRKLITVLMKTP